MAHRPRHRPLPRSRRLVSLHHHPLQRLGRAAAADTFIYSNDNGNTDNGSISIFGSVTQNGGNVTVRHYGGDCAGIYSGNSITVNGGTLDVKSDEVDALSVVNALTDGDSNFYTTTAELASGNIGGKTLRPYEPDHTIAYDGNGSTGQEWISYVADANLAVPQGLTAYIVTGVTATEAVVTPVDYLPKDVPVLLYRTDTDVNSYVAYQDYALYRDEFVLLGAGQMASGTMFLKLPADSNGAHALRIGMSATSIDNLQWTMDNDQWYTIDGRKLGGKPSGHGVYIYDGKKVIK